ncbi:MAG: glycosyltransferase family 4 protein [Acidobacteria bacterium]|nr:glycosyltransferase family 4 protein [Acidobacteriota bacterium]
MKILLYSWPFYPRIGGLERLTEVTANCLLGEGHEVTVVTATLDQDHSSPAFPFPVERRPGLRRLARLVRWSDVIQLNTFHAKIVALAGLSRRPMVWQHIDYDTISPRGICFRTGRACAGNFRECYRCLRQDHSMTAAARALASLILKRTCASAMAANAISTDYAMERMRLPRAVRLPWGIDLSRFVPREKPPLPPLRVFFHGRHIPAKGCDVLVRAARDCRDRGVPLVVRIAGDGPHRAASEALAGDLGLAGEIAFLGFLPEERLLSELQAAHVQVVPTIQDEIGQLSAVEAMCCGCAVVASAIGAMPEYLGGAGLLFPAGNPGELADRLARLAADPALLATSSEKGMILAGAEYDCRVMGRRYIELYEKVRGVGRQNALRA